MRPTAKRIIYAARRKTSTGRGTLANFPPISVDMLEEAEDKVRASKFLGDVDSPFVSVGIFSVGFVESQGK